MACVLGAQAKGELPPSGSVTPEKVSRLRDDWLLTSHTLDVPGLRSRARNAHRVSIEPKLQFPLHYKCFIRLGLSCLRSLTLVDALTRRGTHVISEKVVDLRGNHGNHINN